MMDFETGEINFNLSRAPEARGTRRNFKLGNHLLETQEKYSEFMSSWMSCIFRYSEN
jgi:hypothetical protein